MFAFGVFEVERALVGELNYLIRSFLIWAEPPVHRVRDVSNHHVIRTRSPTVSRLRWTFQLYVLGNYFPS